VLVIANRGRRLRSLVRGLVEESEIRTRPTFASETDTAMWRAWLKRANVAVQVLEAPELVVPAFLAESLALGVPTVVSDIGPLSELPEDAVVKLAAGTPPALVAGALLTVIDDEQPNVGIAGAAYARANAVEDLSDRVVELIFG
jgi:glycosyltransferase involved in cell wall biosynthesis